MLAGLAFIKGIYAILSIMLILMMFYSLRMKTDGDSRPCSLFQNVNVLWRVV
jgi:hypothetical protein